MVMLITTVSGSGGVVLRPVSHIRVANVMPHCPPSVARRRLGPDALICSPPKYDPCSCCPTYPTAKGLSNLRNRVVLVHAASGDAAIRGGWARSEVENDDTTPLHRTALAEKSHEHRHDDHDHCGHHDHHHGHHHDHHHHDHGHHHHGPDAEDLRSSIILRMCNKCGLFEVSEHLEHDLRFTYISVFCFIVSFAIPFLATFGGLSSAWVSTVVHGLLAVTYIISGTPQLAETILAMVKGKIDTHVLMSFAIVGTVYMNMAQEGALLLILFRVSHLLEDKLTDRAQGSIRQLLDTIPDKATLVQLDSHGDPVTSTARVEMAAKVVPGQYVLVRPGEQVPLDGVVVRGQSNVTLHHITGESRPLRMTVGAEVPAGSVSTDGLLVVRVTNTSEDSTPARIARLAAEAQASRPKIQRWLDDVGGIWSKAVIAATLATAFILPLFGVPFLEAGGSLYRAMGVLTAGSPCALVLVPLAYVSAVAAITRRGILVKAGAVLDAINHCHTVALDKTGTLTSGSLSLVGISTICFAQKGTAISGEGANDREYPAGEEDTVVTGTAGSKVPGSAPKRLALHLDQEGKVIVHNQNRESLISSNDTHLHRGHDQSRGVDRATSETRELAVQYAVALSRLSTHPVSRAMVEYGADVQEQVKVQQFEQVPGAGVQGACQHAGSAEVHLVRFGSLDWIRSFMKNEEQMAALDKVAQHQSDKAVGAVAFLTITPVTLSPDGPAAISQQVTMFSFEDVVQEGVEEAVQKLREGSWSHSGRAKASRQKDVVMLTGDTAVIAEQVGRSVGISQVESGLRPEDKLAFVQHSSGGLMMVGDGINDAPALAAAQVGVAIAQNPSDMVAAAGDVIILNGQGVKNLPWLFRMARDTRLVVQQNLALALISVAVATLPTIAGLFPLWLAVTLHEGSTLLVALNSLRLLIMNRPPPQEQPKPLPPINQENGQEQPTSDIRPPAVGTA